MNRTISLPDIIAELAEMCNTQPEAAGEFLHALAATVAEGLAEDKNVKLKNIGTFKVIDDEQGPHIAFLADSKLSETVNAPFALFEAVVLDDSVSEDQLNQAAEDLPTEDNPVTDEEIEQAAEEIEQINEPVAPQSPSPEPEPLPRPAMEAPASTAPVPPPTQDHETEAVGESRPSAPSVPPPIPPRNSTNEPPRQQARGYDPPVYTAPPVETPSVPVPEPVQSSAPKDEVEISVSSKAIIRSHTTVWILVAILCMIVGLVIGYFGFPWINLHQVKNVKIEADNVSVTRAAAVDSIVAVDSVATVAVPDSIPVTKEPEAVAAVPAVPKVVTDTVTGTNYLSRIARKHYGRDIFWVYIYQENSDKISNPNNIVPGTVVVIPPAEKYGIDPADRKSIQHAEVLSARILSEHGQYAGR